FRENVSVGKVSPLGWWRARPAKYRPWCKGSAASSVAGGRNAKFNHLGNAQQMLGELVGVIGIAASDHHPVLKCLALADQPRRKVGDGKAVRADQFAKLVFGHDGLASEAQVMVSIKFSWQLALGNPKNAQDGQRGDAAEYGGHPETDANKNADGGGHPNGSGGGQPAHRQPFLEN